MGNVFWNWFHLAVLMDTVFLFLCCSAFPVSDRVAIAVPEKGPQRTLGDKPVAEIVGNKSPSRARFSKLKQPAAFHGGQKVMFSNTECGPCSKPTGNLSP